MRAISGPTRATGHETRLLKTLLLFVGIALGAGVFEECVVIPRWANATTSGEVAAQLRHSGHLTAGQRFWPRVGVPTIALTAVNLTAANRCRGQHRRWWQVSAYTIAACEVATVRYFVPRLRRLATGEKSDAEARALASRWVALDRVRVVVGASAFLAGLTALSLASPTDPASRSSPKHAHNTGASSLSA